MSGSQAKTALAKRDFMVHHQIRRTIPEARDTTRFRITFWVQPEAAPTIGREVRATQQP